jgi:hypothetical protein
LAFTPGELLQFDPFFLQYFRHVHMHSKMSIRSLDAVGALKHRLVLWWQNQTTPTATWLTRMIITFRWYVGFCRLNIVKLSSSFLESNSIIHLCVPLCPRASPFELIMMVSFKCYFGDDKTTNHISMTTRPNWNIWYMDVIFYMFGTCFCYQCIDWNWFGALSSILWGSNGNFKIFHNEADKDWLYLHVYCSDFDNPLFIAHLHELNLRTQCTMPEVIIRI